MTNKSCELAANIRGVRPPEPYKGKVEFVTLMNLYVVKRGKNG